MSVVAPRALLLFVTTQYGQDSKMIYFFIISVPTIVIATVLLILSFSIALLVYFKKIKKKKGRVLGEDFL
jgi:hypothetical protein